MLQLSYENLEFRRTAYAMDGHDENVAIINERRKAFQPCLSQRVGWGTYMS